MSDPTNDGEGLRFLLYAHDSVGIGHMVRACTLARALRRRLSRAEIAIASGSPALQRFAPAGCIPLGLPPHVWADSSAPDFERQRRLGRPRRRWRRAVLKATIQEFAPHVMLVDHQPAGKKEELTECLELLAARGAALVLGYRRIAEDLECTRETLASPAAASLLTGVYRMLLVYAPPWIGERLGPLVPWTIPQQHTGWVCRRRRLSRAAARRRLGIDRTGPIVACGLGGGRNAWPLAERILRSWRSETRHGMLLLFCGPFLEPPRGFHPPRVRLIRRSAAFPLGVAASDGVICTAGYNSLLETLYQGRPLWAIPHQETESEQERSSALLQEEGYLRRLLADNSLEHELRSAFNSISSGQTAFRKAPAEWFQGPENVAGILAGLGCKTLGKGDEKETACVPPSV